MLKKIFKNIFIQIISNTILVLIVFLLFSMYKGYQYYKIKDCNNSEIYTKDVLSYLKIDKIKGATKQGKFLTIKNPICYIIGENNKKEQYLKLDYLKLNIINNIYNLNKEQYKIKIIQNARQIK